VAAEATDPLTLTHIESPHGYPELAACRAHNLDTDEITGIAQPAALYLLQRSVMLCRRLLRLRVRPSISG
jgi:hypothetical protein